MDFKAFLDRVKAFLVIVSHLPLVEPLLELLSLQRVMVLLAGAVAFYLIPTIQGISPEWADRLGNLVFYGSLALFGGIQVDKWLETRKGLPADLSGILAELITQFQTWLIEQMAKGSGDTPVPAPAPVPPAGVRLGDKDTAAAG